jgi:DNA-binding CsgD family transcriptional regulator
VVESLRRAVDAQLVEVDGHDFRFRHGLTREAVLGELLPPERQELSRLAWPAIEHAHPGLEGTWCELAAELAEASGDPVAAAERLVVSARRALDAGALATAQSTVERARALARGTVVAIDADECFVTVTSLAGKPSEALEVGRPLAHQLDNGDAPHERLILLLVVLARAAVAAGDLATADSYIRRARRLVDDHRELHAIRAAVEAVAAHVALGNDDLVGAEELATAAIQHAAVSGRPDVACEALEVLGRVARTRSSTEAIAAFERAAALAEEHGLTGWSLRARQELALERWVDGDTTGLSETRDLAARHGAMVTVAVMDLSLADIALSSFDRDRCMQHATKCVEASRRYGLATLPVAELWLAGAHALAGDDAAMDSASARALERDPDDPRILGDLWGRVRATRSMVRDDREQLVADLDRMMEYVDLAPVTTSIYPNRLVWVLLHSIDDDDLGVAARRRLEGLAHLGWWTSLAAVLDLSRAVTLGRQARGAEAARLAAQGLASTRQTATADGTIHYIHLLVADAQIRDGWGEPAELLRPAEAFFAERGYDAIARRCRVALGRAGEKMPRRGRGATTVPEHLRAVGITSREFDVLSLIVDGCSNREIGKHLHLSPKTVEHHVSSLFDRTGIRSRAELADWVTHAGN